MEALKGVWGELEKIWNQIYDMKELAWNALFPRKIRTRLDQLLIDLKNMPNRIRQYQAFDFVQDQGLLVPKDILIYFFFFKIIIS